MYNIAELTKAEELLKFNLDNKAVKELDLIWDECLTKKKELAEQGMKTSDMINTFIKWFSLNQEPRFVKTVKDHFGIAIETVTYNVGYYMWSEGRDIHKFIEGLAAAEGKHKLEGKSLISQLEDFEKALDLEKGVVIMNKIPLKIRFGINLDLKTSFFSKELTVGNLFWSEEKTKFSSQEITAIVLHEIGHIFTMIYVSSKVGHTAAFNSASLRQLVKSVRNSSIDELDKTVTDLRKKVSKKDHGATAVFDIFDNVRSKISSVEMGIVTDAIIRLCYILECIILIYASVNLVASTAIAVILGNRYSMFVPDGASTTTVTNKSSNYLERLADEFVASFGYGQYLNTGLPRYVDMVRFSHPKEVMDKLNSKYLIFSPIGMLMATLVFNKSLIESMVGLIGSQDRSTYESIDVRLERNIANLYNILNTDPSLTQEHKRYIVTSIETMRADLKNNNGVGGTVKLFIRLVTMVPFRVALLPVVTVADLMTNANMRNELETILNDMEKLANNPLEYHAARLINLTR